MIAQLGQTPPSRVRTFFTPDVGESLAIIEAQLGAGADVPVVALAWPSGANLARGIDQVVWALAGVAWARWPDWYGLTAPFAQPDVGVRSAPDRDGPAIDRVGRDTPALNRAWVTQALHRCRRGERPLVGSLPAATQVRQLILALAEPETTLLLVLEYANADGAMLRAFANTAAWAAAETGVRVAAFVPAVFRRAPELDIIAYDAVDWAERTCGEPVSRDRGERNSVPLPASTEKPARNASKTPASRTASDGSGANTASTAPRRANDEPLRLVFPPVLGCPHPSSPGEQLLAQWLARDGELAPLFEYNQRIETSSGEAFVVDLLWRAGRLAVEVDGYGWHSSPHAFAADRHRDYRLLCDGYRTLRLPHDEVIDDPALQCEKIRDVVRAIRKER